MKIREVNKVSMNDGVPTVPSVYSYGDLVWRQIENGTERGHQMVCILIMSEELVSSFPFKCKDIKGSKSNERVGARVGIWPLIHYMKEVSTKPNQNQCRIKLLSIPCIHHANAGSIALQNVVELAVTNCLHWIMHTKSFTSYFSMFIPITIQMLRCYFVFNLLNCS